MAALGAAAVVLAACRDAGSPVPGGSGPAGTVPDVAHVVCGDAGTRVLTPRVLTRPDGVHFRVENRTPDRTTYLAILDGDAVAAPPGETEGLSAVAPGRVRLACATESSYPEESSFPSLEVVDEGGYWVSDRMDCPDDAARAWVIDYVIGARGEQGDPPDIARENIRGIRETDVVEPAGYAEGPEGKVRVVRDGGVVAVLDYADDEEGGWLLSMGTACEGSGIG